MIIYSVSSLVYTIIIIIIIIIIIHTYIHIIEFIYFAMSKLNLKII